MGSRFGIGVSDQEKIKKRNRSLVAEPRTIQRAKRIRFCSSPCSIFRKSNSIFCWYYTSTPLEKSLEIWFSLVANRKAYDIISYITSVELWLSSDKDRSLIWTSLLLILKLISILQLLFYFSQIWILRGLLRAFFHSIKWWSWLCFDTLMWNLKFWRNEIAVQETKCRSSNRKQFPIVCAFVLAIRIMIVSKLKNWSYNFEMREYDGKCLLKLWTCILSW